MKKGTKKGRLTQDNFDWFCSEVKYWMHFLGNFEWDCRFTWEKEEEAKAWVSVNRNNGIASFGLSKTWESPADQITKRTISRSAFHESCEILLDQLGAYAYAYGNESTVDREVHRIVRKLENTVFESEWSRRFPKLS